VALVKIALRQTDTHWQLDVFVDAVNLDPRGRLCAALVQDMSGWSGHRGSGSRQQCNEVQSVAQHLESG